MPIFVQTYTAELAAAGITPGEFTTIINSSPDLKVINFRQVTVFDLCQLAYLPNRTFESQELNREIAARLAMYTTTLYYLPPRLNIAILRDPDRVQIRRAIAVPIPPPPVIVRELTAAPEQSIAIKDDTELFLTPSYAAKSQSAAMERAGQAPEPETDPVIQPAAQVMQATEPEAAGPQQATAADLIKAVTSPDPEPEQPAAMIDPRTIKAPVTAPENSQKTNYVLIGVILAAAWILFK